MEEDTEIKKKKTIPKKTTTTKKKSNSSKKRTTLSNAKKTTTKKSTTPKKKSGTTKKTTTAKNATSSKKKTTTKKEESTKKTTTTMTPTPKKSTTKRKYTRKTPLKTTKTTKITKKPTLKEEVVKEVEKEVKREIKKVYKKRYQGYFFIGFILITFLYNMFYIAPIPSIKNVSINDKSIISIKVSNDKYKFRDKLYCYFSTLEEAPDKDDKKWTLMKNNKCDYQIDDHIYYAYIKNEDNVIFEVKEVSKTGRVIDLKINKDEMIIANNDTFKYYVSYVKIGYVEDAVKWTTSNSDIAIIDSEGKATGLMIGSTKVTATIAGESVSSELIISDLITTRHPGGFDFNKPDLKCDTYTKEENDLLDKILKDRIDGVGYKTRAGVVEAARFLTLDFPYKINYFYENGRQTTNNVDGEGRYYHVGLYLDSSRYENITGKQYGPKEWGCSLYDRPSKEYNINGLDCSGFVSWALLNGGFDVKDVGAGWSNNLDLTDYGKVKKITDSVVKSGEIKVGDLLHSTKLGGHIGIIVGQDDKYYYVAQAIWYDAVGVIITPYEKYKLYKEFPHVVLMDNYYKEDGKLTDMW